jgi:fumarate reductase flavoprotein subunit
VFGGIAGDSMPRWVKSNGGYQQPDASAIDGAVARCRAPLAGRAGDLEAIRETLYTLMWDDVGIMRDAAGLARAESALDALEAELDRTGIADSNLAYSLSWHDWLNLKNLILVSKSIRQAAMAREDSRGAHYRTDFPEVRNLESSHYTCVTLQNDRLHCTTRPVHFTRVKPGETLLQDATPA